MTPILMHIKANSPLGFLEFEQFVSESEGIFFNKHQITLNDMPFTMTVGLFLAYFNHNQIDFSVGSVDEDILTESIQEAFDDYEKVISHYS